MARKLRTVAIGLPHHMTQRGNHRQAVFFTVEDRQRYLRWLREYAQRYQLRVWAYCLMPVPSLAEGSNHIHLVATPNIPFGRKRQTTHTFTAILA